MTNRTQQSIANEGRFIAETWAGRNASADQVKHGVVVASRGVSVTPQRANTGRIVFGKRKRA